MNKQKTILPVQANFAERMIGFCSACGAEVIDLKKDKRARFLPNYRDHLVELDNNSMMRVAVCEKCKIELASGKSKKTADKILENHKTYWNNHKAPQGFEKFKIVDSNTSKSKFFRKREKRQQEEELNKLIQTNVEF